MSSQTLTVDGIELEVKLQVVGQFSTRCYIYQIVGPHAGPAAVVSRHRLGWRTLGLRLSKRRKQHSKLWYRITGRESYT